MFKEDYYRLLGISSNANEQSIRKAWRLKTKEVHPDINKTTESSQAFLELKEAMEVLLDPIKRLQHDRQFGYYSPVPNQDKNAKQEFSEYQKVKAEKNVTEWANDYEKVMQIRDEQRMKTIKKHKRRNRIVMVFFLLLVILTLVVLIYSFAN
jgi:DnaJ-class molecular chaperone